MLRRSEDEFRALVIDGNDASRTRFVGVLESEGIHADQAAAAGEALRALGGPPADAVLADLFLPGIPALDLLAVIREAWPEAAVLGIVDFAALPAARAMAPGGGCRLVPRTCSPLDVVLTLERALPSPALQRLRSLPCSARGSEAALDALLSALDAGPLEAPGHCERVTAFALEIARALHLPEAEVRALERGALLHDVGLVAVPDAILRKPGPLTAEEWQEMRRHPGVGFRLCARMERLEGAARIVLHHHERWDGGGYPDGLRGGSIPLGARVAAVADALEALTAGRPWKPSVPVEAALAEIARCAAAQFDPRVVQALLDIPVRRIARIPLLISDRAA